MVKEIIKVDWEKIMKDKKELKKYNHIIDGKKPRSMGLLARNLMNILLYIREKENTNQFQVPIAELRAYLKLTTNDYKNRIEKAIYELSIPMELRDFKYKGKEIAYVPASLLIEPTIYKDNINYVDINISEKFIAALEEKMGFTALDFMKLLECSTKFGHEIAQMIFRYKNLPNKLSNGSVRITKTIDDLNNMFGTNYKYVSDMSRKLDAGYKDIQDSLGIEYLYYYNEIEKEFVFTWIKEENEDRLYFPRARLKELAEWICDHYHAKTRSQVTDRNKFVIHCIGKLKKGEWEDADKAYRGMLQRKYNLDPDSYFDAETNKYIDFKVEETK